MKSRGERIIRVLSISIFVVAFFGVGGQARAAENQNSTISSNIVLSEIMVKNYIDPADNLKKNEFIELYNTSDQIVDLTGWKLAYTKLPTKSSCQIIAGSPISPTKEYLFTGEEDKVQLPANSFFTLSYYDSFDLKYSIQLSDSTGAEISLFDQEGTKADSFCYDKVVDNQSYSRIDGQMQLSSIITPGAANQLPKIEQNLPPESQISDIEKARHGRDDQRVTIQGIVTAVPGDISDSYFYLQDNTGGLQIYCYGKNFPYLQSGDVIQVTGILSTINNERRLKIENETDITIIASASPPPPQNVPIENIGEPIEGELITTTGIVSETSGSEFTLADDGYLIKVVIKNPDQVQKPKLKRGETVQVTGIVSQYKDYYRILPFEAGSVRIIFSSDEVLLPVSGIGDWLYLLVFILLEFICVTFLKAKMKQPKLQMQSPKKRRVAIFLLYLEIWAAARQLSSKVSLRLWA